MTRKDYILIAEILQKANDGNWGILGTAKMFADMLHADNPRFDREHFLAVVRGEKELNSKPSRKNTEPDSLYGKRCARCGAHFYRNGACECLR